MTNHTLHPCNQCWSGNTCLIRSSEIVYRQCSLCGFQDTGIDLLHVLELDILRLVDYQWNASNPISHAGKMLLEQNTTYKHRLFAEPNDWWMCKCCESKIELIEDTNLVTISQQIKHSPTCPLITEARLPLKVKE